MADEAKEKSLEMRVAELEDKLSKVHITEEEMKAYQKVSSLMGGGAGGGISPQSGCILDCSGGCISECRVCLIRQCIRYTIIRQPIIRQPIIRDCFECGGECLPGGGGIVGGGGFGGFGG